jgi:hypothetical protein
LDQLREKVEEQTEAISFREEKNENTSPPKLNEVFNLYPNKKLRIGVFTKLIPGSQRRSYG